MQSNHFYNSPYDMLDIEIKQNFQKKYGLCLNKLNYEVFGIVENCFLISLIGESFLFHVYLGYKNGLFYSVKIMKRSKYDTKEATNQRIELFEKEVDIRLRFQEQHFNKNLQQIKIQYVDFNKYIIYEDYCANATMNYYNSHFLTEKLIRTLFLSIVDYLRQINKGSRYYHKNLSLDNIAFDEEFNFKLLGARNYVYSKISMSSFYHSSFSIVNEDEITQINSLIVILCEMLFKDDYVKILPFLRNNLQVVNLQQQQDEEKEMIYNNFNNNNYYNENDINDDSNNSNNEHNFNSKNDNNNNFNEHFNETFNLKSLDKLNTMNNNESYISSHKKNLESNMKLLDTILVELIEKYTMISAILDKNSLKDFIKKLIKDRSFEDIEFTTWYNSDIFEKYEYYMELNKYRIKALEKNFSVLGEKEKHLIRMKKGIFKVIK